MQERDKEELADALSRMASGDDADVNDSADVAQSGAAEATPPVTPLFRAAQPSQTSPSTPHHVPAQAIVSKPQAQSRPAAPPIRPAMPNLTPPAPVRDQTADVPATASSHSSARRNAPPPLYRRLSFRQTLIPILLTLGVLLPVLGMLPFVVSADSPLAAVQSGVAATFIVIGLAMLGLAIVNVIQVRHQLLSSKMGR